MWSHLGAGDCTDIYFCQAARHRVLATPGLTEYIRLGDRLGQSGRSGARNDVNLRLGDVAVACKR